MLYIIIHAFLIINKKERFVDSGDEYACNIGVCEPINIIRVKYVSDLRLKAYKRVLLARQISPGFEHVKQVWSSISQPIDIALGSSGRK